MNPDNIHFNALIVGPTNSGKTRFLVNQLGGTFCGRFDYIVLICPSLTTRPYSVLKERPAFLSHHLRATLSRTLFEINKG